MAGVGIRNTAGVPDVKEYHIGGGKMFIAEILASGLPGAFRHVGNVPEITMTVSTDQYEHMSSTTPVPVQDLSVITKVNANMKFKLENKNAENLALFFLGDATAYTNPGIAGLSAVTLVAEGALEKNSWYQIVKGGSGTDKSNPVFGISSTNAIALITTETVPVSLVKDTDYTVDAVTGMVFIKDTAKITTCISANKGINVTLTADAAATLVDKVAVLSDTSKKVAIRLVSYNSSDNNKVTIYDFHKVSLAADGDTSMITSEVSGLPMTGGVEDNSAYTNRVDIYTPITQA